MPRKKQVLIGNGMNANLLKEFIDLSYKGNTSIAPEGYSIDAPLSDSRVKVYTKNGSNDKNVVVTHRGSVGLDDWMDNASYLFKGKVKGTKTYNLHRERHKKAVEKYGAKNITAIGHSRAGLYLQELQKEFPIKENITYNKASGFYDIGRENDPNQTDVKVGNDFVSLLAPLQKRPNQIVNISGTKNPFDFNTAHQPSELDKLGTTFIGKKEEEEPNLTLKPIVALRPDKPKPNPSAMLEYGKNNLTKLEGSGNKAILKPKTLDQLKKELVKYEKQLAKIEKSKTNPYKTITKESATDLILLTKERITSYEKTGKDIDREKKADYSSSIPKKLNTKDRKDLAFILKPITEEIAVEDYKKLEKQKKKIPPMTSNDGNKFVDYFTFVERLNTKTKRGYSFYDFWENKDEEAKKNYFQKLFTANSDKKGYETNIYDIFRLYFGSVNIFKPVIAMEIYNKYKPTSILDPTMGWGGRLMGATILDVPKYTGVDLNPNLEQPYADMVEQIKKIGTKTKIKLFIPQDSLKVDYSKLDYDMVFTSPPYYNVEIYTGTNRVNRTKGSTIRKEWNENFYKPLFSKTWEHLKLGGHYIINVPKEVYNDVLLPLLGECDDKIPLKLSARKSKKYIEGKKEKEYGEFIYVWKKNDLKPLFYGEGIQPRISGEEEIRKLLGVEERRLERIKDGTTKYYTKYITKQKTLEKIGRLKERLKSAIKNKGHASEDFFVPKTETWLKINKQGTYLDTPLKEDGKHKLMLTEIEKRIAEIKDKKEAKKQKTTEQPKEEANVVMEVKDLKQEIKQEIKKVEVAFEEKVEEPKKKLTKEERKKARLAKKSAYDKKRYLQIKAKKLEAQTKATTTEKQVEKLEEKVEAFKEEVKEFVEDEDDEEDEEEEEEEEEDDEDLEKMIAETMKQYEIDKIEDDKKVELAKLRYMKKYKDTHYLTTPISSEQLKDIEKFAKLKNITDYLGSEFPPKTSQENSAYREKQNYRFRQMVYYIADGRRFYIDKELDNFTKSMDNEGLGYMTTKKIYDFGLYDNYNGWDYDIRKKQLEGSGFNKKQLRQIILDKNKVIADLEETAYGRGIYPPNPQQHSYLDNILDSNTTSQNIIIHREHFNSVPKYIKTLVGD